MNKRGSALIFTFLVIVVLAILSSSFYYKTINEDKLTKRHLANLRALWLAEAGIAEAIEQIPITTSIPSTSLGGNDYTYSADIIEEATNFFKVTSTGSVISHTGETITRTLKAYVRRLAGDPGDFPYAIESTTNIEFKGEAWSITGDNCTPGVDCYKEYSTLSFQDLFGYSVAELRDLADYSYDVINYPETFPDDLGDGIVWVTAPSGENEYFDITGNLTNRPPGGENNYTILIIEGNAHFGGTVDFNGIIYVIGALTIKGTVTVTGTVLAESSTTVDTEIAGNVTLTRDTNTIANSLAHIEDISKSIVAWYESKEVAAREPWWEEE